MKTSLLSLLCCAAVGLSTEAAAASPLTVVCDGGGTKLPPVYLMQSKNGQLLRMEVKQLPNGRYQSSRAAIPPGLVEKMCADRIPVSTMPLPEDVAAAEGVKIGVSSYVPSSFSIVGYTFIGY